MSQPRRKSRQNRRGGEGKKPLELWQPRPSLPELPVEVVTPDPTALIRSLGPAPLYTDIAEHYLAVAVARAAVLASALGVSAGVLRRPDDADDLTLA